MKRAALVTLALFVAAPAVAQVTVVGEIKALRAQVSDLQGQIGDLTTRLTAAEAKATTLATDIGLVIGRYDTLLRAIVINVCTSNKVMADNQWAATLAGLKPIPLPGHTCPADPGNARYYVPSYLSPSGPPIPPAQ